MPSIALTSFDRSRIEFAQRSAENAQVDKERLTAGQLTKHDSNFVVSSAFANNIGKDIADQNIRLQELTKELKQLNANAASAKSARTLVERMQNLADAALETSSADLRKNYSEQAEEVWGQVMNMLTDDAGSKVDPYFASALRQVVLPVAQGMNTFSINGADYDLYVETNAGKNWVLVGRGREGWEFDFDGQGNFADVADLTTLGTTAAFDPAAYSNQFLEDMFTSAGFSLGDAEMRLKRAADIAGTTYQEERWTLASNQQWTWDLDGTPFNVAVEWDASSVGAGSPTAAPVDDTRDTLQGSGVGNDETRVFTVAWGGHGSQRGFSYGSTVEGVNNNDPNTFMWENGTERHAIPYAEVYLDATGIDALLTTPGMITGTGLYNFTIGGVARDLYIEEHNGTNYVLIGRGREGWDMDTDGQGAVADVANVAALGTTAAFTPAAYDDAYINQILTDLGTDLTGRDIRIKRAATITGSSYQNVYWRSQTDPTFSFDLEGGNRFNVAQTWEASALGPGFSLDPFIEDTRDLWSSAGNNHERVFTFAWANHGGQAGFSYGSSIQGVDNNDPNTFMWENTTERYALPYTEVYLEASAFEPLLTTPGTLNPGALNNFTIGGTPIDMYVEAQGGDNYVLIGRGREGWEFDTDGQGVAADVANLGTLGTTAAFAPAYYDDAFVNQMLTDAGIALGDTTIRIKRAADTAGTDYQEMRWNVAQPNNFSWDFDAANAPIYEREIISSPFGATPVSGIDDGRDHYIGGNDHRRSFQMAWSGHNFEKGFSYGNGIDGVDNDDPNTFLWEYGTERNAIPYTEVYLDADNLTPIITPTSVGSADFLRGNPAETGYQLEFGWMGSATNWFNDADIESDMKVFDEIMDSIELYENIIETEKTITETKFDQIGFANDLLLQNQTNLITVDLSRVGTDANISATRHTLALSAIALAGQGAQSSLLSLFSA